MYLLHHDYCKYMLYILTHICYRYLLHKPVTNVCYTNLSQMPVAQHNYSKGNGDDIKQ